MYWETSAPESFNEVVGRKPQAYYFIKKRDSSAGGNLQNFEEHLFYRTAVDDCFWIYQNNNCQKVSVSELIIDHLLVFFSSFASFIRHFFLLCFSKRARKQSSLARVYIKKIHCTSRSRK